MEQQSNSMNYLQNFNSLDWDLQQSNSLYKQSFNHYLNQQNDIFSVINMEKQTNNNSSKINNPQQLQQYPYRSQILPFNSNEKQFFSEPQIYLGSFSSYCIGYNVQFTYTKVILQLNKERYYLAGKQPIQLLYKSYNKLSSEQVQPFTYHDFRERTLKCQKFLKQIHFSTSLIKQNTLIFQPMYINCWKLLFMSKQIRLQISTNITKNHVVGSLLVPIKIDIYLKTKILNESSLFCNKSYIQIIKEYEFLKQQKNTCQNILRKLEKNRQQIFYEGQKYQTKQQFYNTYYTKNQAFRYFNRQEVQEAKVVRLFILFLMQKLKINIINRSFIKPRPKMNYFINWFLNRTIGRRTNNTEKKHKIHMQAYLISDQINLLINKQQDYLQYYKDNLQNQQQSHQQMNEERQLNQPIKLYKNWIQNQSQKLIDIQLNIVNKKLQLKIAYADIQTLTQDEISIKAEKQNQIKSLLGLIKQNQTKQNQEIEQQNTKLLKQFEKQNKYFKVHQTPSKMTTKLHDYQGQALQWMKYRQGKLTVQQLFQQSYLDEKEEDFQFQRKLSPFWSQISLRNGQILYINYITGQITKQFHPWRKINGGILADEMGLGKTVMAISLLVDDNFEGLNLIVVPVNVMKQWIDQLKTHCKKQIKIFQYHQNSDRRKQNLYNYDVIITTYGTLGNEEKAYKYQNGQKNEKGLKFLFDYQFRRVILDQAQNIKCPTTLQFQGANRLKTQFKWCLTGTVVQNTQQDLFAIFKFLDVEVFSQQYWWNSYIKRCQNQAEKFNIIYTVLRPLLLRRTKQSKDLDQRVIITLPPRKQFVIRPQFTDQQAKIYDQLQLGIKLHFNQMTQRMKKSFTHVFQILSRLRQFCCHPSLIFKKKVQDIQEQDVKSFLQKFIKVGSQVFKNQTIEKILEDKQEIVCPICQENPKQLTVVTSCGHIYCQPCLKMLEKRIQQNCAVCRQKLTGQFFRKSLNKDKQIKQQMNSIIEEDSSKMKAVMEILKQIYERKQKCIIFSQWVKIIQILKNKMNEMDYKWVSITGDMSKNQRSQSVSLFKNDNNYSFMIVSLKAGGTGLNLTMANNVMICDPWWNPAHQDQAIHRVHRIGQQKQVNVYRFLIKNSIQQKIQKMHMNKRKLADKVMMRNPKKIQNEKNQTQEMIEMIVNN